PCASVCDLVDLPTRRSSDLDISENTFRAPTITDEELAALQKEAKKAVAEYSPEPAKLDLKADLNGLLFYEGEDYYRLRPPLNEPDRKSTRLNSSHVKISYAV